MGGEKMVEVDIRLKKLPKLNDPTKGLGDPTKGFVNGNGKKKNKSRKRSRTKAKRK